MATKWKKGGEIDDELTEFILSPAVRVRTGTSWEEYAAVCKIFSVNPDVLATDMSDLSGLVMPSPQKAKQALLLMAENGKAYNLGAMTEEFAEAFIAIVTAQFLWNIRKEQVIATFFGGE